MSDEARPSPLVKAEPAPPEFKFEHPLNPRSEVWMSPVSRIAGMERLGITRVRVPPGKDSFIYHSHQSEEEFIYILSGRGVAEIGDDEIEVGPGDFMGFPTPSVAHHLTNPFEEDLVYLMGGERRDIELADFPRLGKRLVRDGQDNRLVDTDALEPFPE
jgi:uncharacterized cupin superfamily protein